MEQRAKILVKPQALGARAALAHSTWTLCLLLSACGQRGPLTLPNDNDFKQRATLPDIVRRQLPDFSPSPSSVPPQNTEPARPAAPAASAPQAAPMR